MPCALPWLTILTSHVAIVRENRIAKYYRFTSEDKTQNRYIIYVFTHEIAIQFYRFINNSLNMGMSIVLFNTRL